MCRTIPIKINNRLKRTLGRCLIVGNEIVKIELSGDLIKYGATQVIIDILKHELIHYVMFVKGLPHSDGDATFEQELLRLGVASSGRYCVGMAVEYKCEVCGVNYEAFTKRVAEKPQKYRTKCCDGRLVILGERIYDGKGTKEVC
ncbi:SprT-like protein [Bacillus chungangensis]|uniref:SprT-like protein n=2 Tax=Bacillus chungangensis TaxID=587633 RepID=A0ABT9WMC5_9BACI|nr:SprT-like protein [Bacillus chungangensis]